MHISQEEWFLSSIGDAVITSVYSEKTSLKKLMMMMIKMMMMSIIIKSQKMIVFSVSQKLTSAMKLRPEKG